MGQFFTYPKWRVTDSNGNPLASGKVYFYETGTTTPKATYSDAALTVPNANPLILDANGEGWVFVADAAVYTVVVKTAADVTVWSEDDLSPDPAKTTIVVGTTGKLIGSSSRIKLEETGTTNLVGLTCLDLLISSSGVKITTGTGSPEGVVTAPIGSLFLRLDGGATTTLYVKTSGTGNTGWTAK
jgi:hypothetical protein